MMLQTLINMCICVFVSKNLCVWLSRFKHWWQSLWISSPWTEFSKSLGFSDLKRCLHVYKAKTCNKTKLCFKKYVCTCGQVFRKHDMCQSSRHDVTDMSDVTWHQHQHAFILLSSACFHISNAWWPDFKAGQVIGRLVRFSWKMKKMIIYCIIIY